MTAHRFLALVVAIVLVAAAPAVAAPPVVHPHGRLAPGLRFATYRWRGATWSVLTVHLDRRMIRAIPADYTLPERYFPSTLGIRAGALATVGAGFMLPQVSGQGGWNAFPVNALMIAGNVWSTGAQWPAWGLQVAPGRAYVGANVFDFWAINGGPRGLALHVQAINARAPRRDEIVAWTLRDTLPEHHPIRGCTAVLTPTAPAKWATSRISTKTYIVTEQAQPCAGAQPRRNEIVLNAVPHTPSGEMIRALDVGASITWRMRVPNPQVSDVISGWPMLVADGALAHNPGIDTLPNRGTFSRVALGTNRDGTVAYIVNVDKLDGWSKGAGYLTLARFMLIIGAWDAVNLDGGGSKVMWVAKRGDYCALPRPEGCVTSIPGNGAERATMYATAIF